MRSDRETIPGRKITQISFGRSSRSSESDYNLVVFVCGLFFLDADEAKSPESCSDSADH